MVVRGTLLFLIVAGTAAARFLFGSNMWLLLGGNDFFPLVY